MRKGAFRRGLAYKFTERREVGRAGFGRGLRRGLGRFGLRQPRRLHCRLGAFFFRVGCRVVFFEIFQKIADVEERVGIAANVHEGRLHAGQHARDTAFVDASD